MDFDTTMNWVLLGVSTLLSVLGWLLIDKYRTTISEIDALRKELRSEVERLYSMHHADEQRLYEYKLEVASNHYTQNQIDTRLQHLESTMMAGFREIKAAFNDLSTVVMRTLAEHKVKAKDD